MVALRVSWHRLLLLCVLSLQEPKTDQDEEHCRKVNEYLNNPPMPGALGASGSSGHELSALGGNCQLCHMSSGFPGRPESTVDDSLPPHRLFGSGNRRF